MSDAGAVPTMAPSAVGTAAEPVKTWEIVYMCLVLLFMFIALISDRVGADMVMLTALTLCMAAQIVSVEEGIAGFANEGLLTVIVLFVVAAGISHTGALDWYMGKLLGMPKSSASAQLRLMIPISIVSAFLNNTPVVAVMIPIVQKWSRSIRISAQQLLVPLSFASILGGTCTLIGTSTNLVVVGLLNERYADPPQIGLFDLGEYGVPVAMAGIAYVLIASPFLLPGGKGSKKDGDVLLPDGGGESILLGARLTKWSPAAGRSVQRSGLRDTGGIYLVSVHRAATGNIHRAVGPEFVLNVGDTLFFTGLVESFGDFCEEHGLEVVTNELLGQRTGNNSMLMNSQQTSLMGTSANIDGDDTEREKTVKFRDDHEVLGSTDGDNADGSMAHDCGAGSEDGLMDGQHITDGCADAPPVDMIDISGDDIGITKQSCVSADVESRLRSINRMTDMIRGITPAPSNTEEDLVINSRKGLSHATSSMSLFMEPDAPARIVVVVDTNEEKRPLVVVAINTRDRPGLLLDISRGLLRLGIQLHHSEASVIQARSISIWRCEILDGGVSNIEEIWDSLNVLLDSEKGVEAVKRRGLKVIRAAITKHSALIGKSASEANFRSKYKAAIVAVQKSGKNVPTGSQLGNVSFEAGDHLVLQAADDSPLLVRPPSDFYKNLLNEGSGEGNKVTLTTLMNQISKPIAKRFSRTDLVREGDDASATSSPSRQVKPRQISETTPLSHGDTNNNDNMAQGGSAGDDDYFISEPGSSSQLEVDDVDIEAGTGEGSTAGLVNPTPRSVDDETISDENQELEEVWHDLQVIFPSADGGASSAEGDALSREYLTAMEVEPRSQLSKKTVAQSGLDNLAGVTLVSIERPLVRPDEENPSSNPSSILTKRFASSVQAADAPSVKSSIISAGGSIDGSSLAETTINRFVTIDPETEKLQDGDVIWYAGSANAVGDLRKIPGLRSYQSDEVSKINESVHDRRLVQAVIAKKGPLVGKTVKDVRFRTQYGAAVIAVHREGKRVHQHPGKIKLQAGDVLLLEAGPAFIAANANNSRAFTLLSEVEDSAPPRLKLLIPALFLAVAMLAVFTAGVASLLICALVAAIIMVCIGILSQQEARDAVDWEIYVTIACAFGIGTALTNSGVAGGIANFLVAIGTGLGIGAAGLFGAVYFATFLISNVVTNNAAAALIFPIAMDAAEQTGTDVTLMSYCIMLAASASFMSPFGYQTNLMVYGPGGYKYKDFLWMGTPMQIVLWLLSVALLSYSLLPWYASWIILFVILLLVAVLRIGADLGRKPSQALGDAVQGTTDYVHAGVEGTADAVQAGVKPKTWRNALQLRRRRG